MSKKIIIEICVESFESAIAAQLGGADRIELCADLHLGGLTPPEELIDHVIEELNIPVNILIRPRSGDFCYSDNEFKQMLLDIKKLKTKKVNGFVFGILCPDKTIDVERNKELVELSAPLSTTFHRAFDEVNNPLIEVEKIIRLGFARILTSGQKETAEEGIKLLSDLVMLVKNRIIIMPGGGINEHNVKRIISETSAREIHSSARPMHARINSIQNKIKNIPASVDVVKKIINEANVS